MADDQKQPSARSRLRAFIREQIKGKSEVSLVDVAERAVKFVTQDRALLKAVLLELLKPMIYEEARLVVAVSRETPKAGADPSNNLVQLGDEVVSRNVLRQRADKMSRKWMEFVEHAGDRHVRLLDMTADDLLQAEAERRRRGDAEHEYADLWAKLRSRLESGQTVRNVWSAEEIEATYQSVKRAAA